MEKAVLHATHRTVTGKQVGALRRDGKLPAVMYGHHFDSTAITLDLRDATHILSGLTSSSLVTIELDGKENSALIREKQRDFIRGTLRHVDFQVLSLTEKLRTTVRIELTGLAPAIKDFNGIVVSGNEKIEVECLPQDLPERIVVDISHLNKIGDGLYVRDIKLSDKVAILSDMDEMVVLITAPAAEEVVEEVAIPGAEEPEVIEHGKKEEEEEAES